MCAVRPYERGITYLLEGVVLRGLLYMYMIDTYLPCSCETVDECDTSSMQRDYRHLLNLFFFLLHSHIIIRVRVQLLVNTGTFAGLHDY